MALEQRTMQIDERLRAAARTIYDTCYPSEDWTAVTFEQAETYGTVHYRQAVDAALQTRALYAARGEQLPLFGQA